jgi:hypothetical protein
MRSEGLMPLRLHCNDDALIEGKKAVCNNDKEAIRSTNVEVLPHDEDCDRCNCQSIERRSGERGKSESRHQLRADLAKPIDRLHSTHLDRQYGKVEVNRDATIQLVGSALQKGS